MALGIGACVGATAPQPHMQNALDALRTARSEFQAAEPNKGGHRERAIALVNQAIDETRAGIDCACRQFTRNGKRASQGSFFLALALECAI